MPKRQGGPTPLSKLQDLEAQRTVPQEGAGHPGCCRASRSPPGAQADSGTGARGAAAVEGAAGAATRNGGLPAGHLRPYCERERGPVPGVSWALQCLRPPPEGRVLARAQRPAPSPGPSLPLVCTLVNWVGRPLFWDFSPRLFQKEGLFSSDTSVGLNLVINLQQNTGSLVVFLPGIYVLTNR